MTTILSAIPLWVLPLALGLLWLGLRATRDRQVSPLLVYATPMLGLLSLARASGLAQADLALAALGVALLAGAALGHALQPRWTLGNGGGRVHLRGEWLTLATLLGLFTLNFAAGMVQGMAPGLAAGAGFALGFGLVAGGLSGLLVGRALRVARVAGLG